MNYLQNRESQMQKTIYGYRGERGGGINWETGIDIYTLLYIKQITNKDLMYTNKDLMYNTGNSTQSSGMTYMGKEF